MFLFLQATFIPSAEALDTSYFMSRYIWNPEDEHVDGGSDFDDMSDTGSTCGDSSYGNMLDEEVHSSFLHYIVTLSLYTIYLETGQFGLTGCIVLISGQMGQM